MLAVPVASPATLQALGAEADEIVCVERPARFGAIGEFYLDFTQLADGDVDAMLDEAHRLRSGGESAAAPGCS